MLRRMVFAVLAAVLAAGPIDGAVAAPPHYPQNVTLDGEPTAAETAEVRSVLGRSLGKEWSDYEATAGHRITFTVGHADIDGDGRPDLLVYLSDYGFGYCGSAGCAGYAILATPNGYAARAIYLANSGTELTVLPTAHRGMHDLRFDGSHYIFVWDRARYR